jgi:sulfotransferase
MRIHFISGLPRSGTTLLAALLRQNPRFHARMSSPLFDVFAAARTAMSSTNDLALATDITHRQRADVLTAIVEGFYKQIGSGTVVFDTSRAWTRVLSALALLFPDAKLICCVRSPAWIIDSFERSVQYNGLLDARVFSGENTVYDRADGLMRRHLLGPALYSLRQAWFGDCAGRLIAVRYESLARRPLDVLRALYECLQEEWHPHDPESLNCDEPVYDRWLGLPGLHRVTGPVRYVERQTILPRDIFELYDERFWDKPDQNPRGVRVL